MTHWALLGVPWSSVTNSMYQPDSTRFRFFGTVTEIPVFVFVKSRAMDRWSTSVTWVDALGRISRAVLMDEVCAEVKSAEAPRAIVFGPPDSEGRESR